MYKVHRHIVIRFSLIHTNRTLRVGPFFNVQHLWDFKKSDEDKQLGNRTLAKRCQRPHLLFWNLFLFLEKKLEKNSNLANSIFVAKWDLNYFLEIFCCLTVWQRGSFYSEKDSMILLILEAGRSIF